MTSPVARELAGWAIDACHCTSRGGLLHDATYDKWFIECRAGHCLATSPGFKTEAEAVAWWNAAMRRAPSPVAVPQEGWILDENPVMAAAVPHRAQPPAQELMQAAATLLSTVDAHPHYPPAWMQPINALGTALAKVQP